MYQISGGISVNLDQNISSSPCYFSYPPSPINCCVIVSYEIQWSDIAHLSISRQKKLQTLLSYQGRAVMSWWDISDSARH
jgi:hypothetical protein